MIGRIEEMKIEKNEKKSNSTAKGQTRFLSQCRGERGRGRHMARGKTQEVDVVPDEGAAGP